MTYAFHLIALSYTLVAAMCFLPPEFRTSANLTGFHVFALMHIFTQISHSFRTGSDAFSQKNERIVVKVFFPIALSYTPVAAMCFLPKHLGEFDSV